MRIIVSVITYTGNEMHTFNNYVLGPGHICYVLINKLTD